MLKGRKYLANQGVVGLHVPTYQTLSKLYKVDENSVRLTKLHAIMDAFLIGYLHEKVVTEGHYEFNKKWCRVTYHELTKVTGLMARTLERDIDRLMEYGVLRKLPSLAPQDIFLGKAYHDFMIRIDYDRLESLINAHK